MNATSQIGSSHRVLKGNFKVPDFFSPFTLKLRNEEDRKEFSNFIRKMTRSYSAVLIPLLFVITVIVFVVSQSSLKGERQIEAQLISIMCIVQVVAAAPILGLSYKRLWLIELL